MPGDAQALPFPDDSFDTTIDTFGLCVMPAPQQSLRELARVTRPGGRVLLLEHTRSPLALLGAYQDATAQPVAALGKGCMWNQDVQGMAAAAGLQLRRVEYALGGTISALVAERP